VCLRTCADTASCPARAATPRTTRSTARAASRRPARPTVGPADRRAAPGAEHVLQRKFALPAVLRRSGIRRRQQIGEALTARVASPESRPPPTTRSTRTEQHRSAARISASTRSVGPTRSGRFARSSSATSKPAACRSTRCCSSRPRTFRRQRCSTYCSRSPSSAREDHKYPAQLSGLAPQDLRRPDRAPAHRTRQAS
jgi:hypothetical protein